MSRGLVMTLLPELPDEALDNLIRRKSLMRYLDVSLNTSEGLIEKRSTPRRLIVIHETIGTDSLHWLQRGSEAAGKKASADFLITRKGDILQIGRPGYFTYHTGTARWTLYQDRDYSLNASSIGIELENYPPSKQVITTDQYIACAALVGQLIVYHGLRGSYVLGHYEVALPRGRKSDPETLNWAMLWREMMEPSVEAGQFLFPKEMP